MVREEFMYDTSASVLLLGEWVWRELELGMCIFAANYGLKHSCLKVFIFG
jgi:hypothetical protein